MPECAVADLVDDPDTLPHGQRFHHWRVAAGLSMTAAAQVCGVDPSTVYRWESGRQRHTHTAKNAALEAGIDTMRWAAAKRESGQAAASISELVLEAGRRRRARARTAAA